MQSTIQVAQQSTQPSKNLQGLLDAVAKINEVQPSYPRLVCANDEDVNTQCVC